MAHTSILSSHHGSQKARPEKKRFRPLVNGAVLRQRLGGRLHPTAPGALRARALRP